jgi:GLPGLI family protein
MAIKTIIALFVVLCIGNNSYAQETIEITYKNFSVSEGSSLYKLKAPKTKLKGNWYSIISNDTTFTFAAANEKERKSHLIDGKYPDKPLHHSTYYESKNHRIFETSAFKGNYFIRSEEKLNPKNYWMDTMKTILGYECQAAMIFNGDGDSSTMWIARNIKPDLITFHHYFIVPGIVMQSLNLKHGLYYKAVKVEKTYNKIYFPKDYPQVSLEEFRQKQKRSKDNSTLTNETEKRF